MPDLNEFKIMGRVTRAVDVRYTPKGTACAQVGVVTNRYWTPEGGEKQESATFVDVELFGRRAELAGQYLRKGSNIYFQCRVENDSWEDKDTGAKRTKLKFVAENMQFLDRPDRAQQDDEPPVRNSPPPRRRNAEPGSRRPEDNPGNMGYAGEEEDDIPF